MTHYELNLYDKDGDVYTPIHHTTSLEEAKKIAQAICDTVHNNKELLICRWVSNDLHKEPYDWVEVFDTSKQEVVETYLL